MSPATDHSPPDPLSLFLAGLQAGFLAVLVMLAWLGASALWRGHTFWTAPNQMATLFYGSYAIRTGFAASTPSGIALYVVVYSLLGGVFACSLPGRLTALGTVLVGALVAIAWYWLWFRALGRYLMPLVWLLHSERSMTFGHVLYGALLARYPVYLRKARPPGPGAEGEASEAPAVPAEPVQTPPPEADSRDRQEC
jgi:hypothetical protein